MVGITPLFYCLICGRLLRRRGRGSGRCRCRRHGGLDTLLQSLQAKSGKSGITAQKEDVGHGEPGERAGNLRGNKEKAQL